MSYVSVANLKVSLSGGDVLAVDYTNPDSRTYGIQISLRHVGG